MFNHKNRCSKYFVLGPGAWKTLWLSSCTPGISFNILSRVVLDRVIHVDRVTKKSGDWNFKQFNLEFEKFKKNLVDLTKIIKRPGFYSYFYILNNKHSIRFKKSIQEFWKIIHLTFVLVKVLFYFIVALDYLFILIINIIFIEVYCQTKDLGIRTQTTSTERH